MGACCKGWVCLGWVCCATMLLLAWRAPLGRARGAAPQRTAGPTLKACSRGRKRGPSAVGIYQTARTGYVFLSQLSLHVALWERRAAAAADS